MERIIKRDSYNSTFSYEPIDYYGNEILWINPEKLANDVSNDLISFIKESIKEKNENHNSQKSSNKEVDSKKIK